MGRFKNCCDESRGHQALTVFPEEMELSGQASLRQSVQLWKAGESAESCGRHHEISNRSEKGVWE